MSETRHYQDLFPWWLAAGSVLVGLHAAWVYALRRRLP